MEYLDTESGPRVIMEIISLSRYKEKKLLIICVLTTIMKNLGYFIKNFESKHHYSIIKNILTPFQSRPS